MSYLKIENDKIVEAPFIIKRNGKMIYGYNKDINESMLIEDGYQKFQYNRFNYKIVEDKIVERERKENQQNKEQTVFTKLQIRRAMRELKMETQLNQIIKSNAKFKADWNDAQEIDLNDEMIQNAIASGLITQEIIDKIKDTIQK